MTVYKFENMFAGGEIIQFDETRLESFCKKYDIEDTHDFTNSLAIWKSAYLQKEAVLDDMPSQGKIRDYYKKLSIAFSKLEAVISEPEIFSPYGLSICTDFPNDDDKRKLHEYGLLEEHRYGERVNLEVFLAQLSVLTRRAVEIDKMWHRKEYETDPDTEIKRLVEVKRPKSHGKPSIKIVISNAQNYWNRTKPKKTFKPNCRAGEPRNEAGRFLVDLFSLMDLDVTTSQVETAIIALKNND